MSSIRRRLMMQVENDALPADYQRVEFIGSSGSEFITIDSFDYSGCVIVFKVRYKTLMPDKNSFGAIKYDDRLEHGVGWGDSAYSSNYGAVGLRVGTVLNQGLSPIRPDVLAHTLRYDPSGLYYDGVKVDDNFAYAGSIDGWGVFKQPLSLRFFGTDRLPTTDRKSDVEIYYWECIKDGVAKIRLIPC